MVLRSRICPRISQAIGHARSSLRSFGDAGRCRRGLLDAACGIRDESTDLKHHLAMELTVVFDNRRFPGETLLPPAETCCPIAADQRHRHIALVAKEVLSGTYVLVR